MGALLSILGDAEHTFLRSPPGPAYARLGSLWDRRLCRVGTACQSFCQTARTHARPASTLPAIMTRGSSQSHAAPNHSIRHPPKDQDEIISRHCDPLGKFEAMLGSHRPHLIQMADAARRITRSEALIEFQVG